MLAAPLTRETKSGNVIAVRNYCKDLLAFASAALLHAQLRHSNTTCTSLYSAPDASAMDQ